MHPEVVCSLTTSLAESVIGLRGVLRKESPCCCEELWQILVDGGFHNGV